VRTKAGNNGVGVHTGVTKAVNPPKSGKLIPAILRPGNRLLLLAQETLNRVFTPQLNPMYFLGAITFLLFWVALASGVYLFVLYEIGPGRAYNSLQEITVNQRYYSGIVRSLHRYSSDGLVLVIIVHMIQVLFSDRFRKYRWVAWVSGAVIIPAFWLEGVSGYFLVWDQVAQMASIAMADMISALPISSEPLQRMFMSNESVTPLLFFVMTYLHITIPLVVLILAWIHCMRISMPLINPPGQITITILASLFILALIKPAVSAGPADLSTLVGTVNIDWFYLGIFVALDALKLSGGHALFWGTAGYAGFIALPWLIPDPKKPVDEPVVAAMRQVDVAVDLVKCKGCPLCQQACPFEAMIPAARSDGGPYDSQAQVVPELCAQCGFCVNACEFGAVSMGAWNKGTFQEYVTGLFASKAAVNGDGVATTMVFICERSFSMDGFLTEDGARVASTPEAAAMVIPCIGALSPSLVQHCFDSGAKGVMAIGCRGLDCHYREERRRLHITKDDGQHKFLVESIADKRFRLDLVSPLQIEKIMVDIDEFNEEVKGKVAI
jgi:coenzyme F420-reducing hydrogenase delta subunit/ferredoxin